MGKTIIIYGSTSGNTEIAAAWVSEALFSAGVKADLFNAAEIAPESVKPYDLVILGSSTWGQGDLQDDFAEFYDGMTPTVFGGKKVAVFGCGDSGMFPDNFCQAVDTIEEKAKECGATIVADSFKIDGDIDAYETRIKEWAKVLM